MDFREYNPQTDRNAVQRIFKEIAWIETEEGEKATDCFLTTGRVLVADLRDEAECMAAAMPGDICYLGETIPLSIVTAVATSRVARKQGLAGRLTAQLIAQEAAAGAAVSTLGMFEQGFYNRLGYGTGSYEHWIRFDPATLTINREIPPPARLEKTDFAAIHAAMLKRKRGHGSCSIYPVNFVEGELHWYSKGFGLGYYDGDDGTLSHFIWGNAKGEYGPYFIGYLCYRDNEDLLDLLAIIKSLGDQVRMIRMCEPQGVQIQDLLKQPIRQRATTEKSDYATGNSALAYWQVRICDLATCLAHTHLPGETLRFNLELSDPIKKYLPSDAPWQGISGDYVLTLGPESSAKPGTDPALPTLQATTGAFSRLWLGVRPASGLAITDRLKGPVELLNALDRTLRLPAPHPGLDY